MGESNTPPVSPHSSINANDSDEEGSETQIDEDFEVIEVYEEDVENEEDGEGKEDEDDMEETDVPDDSLIIFQQHSGMFVLKVKLFLYKEILCPHRFCVLLCI